MILKPQTIIPEFAGDAADDKDFGMNWMRRRRYMAMLDIPMCDDFKSVLFYDVLQQLAIIILMYQYSGKRIHENMLKLRAISIMKHGAASQKDDVMGAITAGGVPGLVRRRLPQLYDR